MLNHNVAKQILKPAHQYQNVSLIQTIRSQLQLYFGDVTTPPKSSPQNFRKTQLQNPDQNTLQIITKPKTIKLQVIWQLGLFSTYTTTLF